MKSKPANTLEIGVRLYQMFNGKKSVEELAQLFSRSLNNNSNNNSRTIYKHCNSRTIYKYFSGDTNLTLERLRILQENCSDVDMQFLILGKHNNALSPTLNCKADVCWYFNKFYSEHPIAKLEQKFEEEECRCYCTLQRYRNGECEPPLIWLLRLQNHFPDDVNLAEWLFHPVNKETNSQTPGK